jgi:hypothetical protein
VSRILGLVWLERVNWGLAERDAHCWAWQEEALEPADAVGVGMAVPPATELVCAAAREAAAARRKVVKCIVEY